MAIAFSEEHYRKISSLIDAQFPGFIRENGPNFVAFLKAYYEYAEKSGNAIDATRMLPDLKDIDRISSDFLSYLTKDILGNIPNNVLSDKRLLAKYIRDIYAARGSEYSYRFLFRSIFGKEIEIFYPSEQILRASDGRWVKETVIRVAQPYSALPTLFEGKTVTGAGSKATGRVESVIQITLNGVPVYELTLSNVTGTFQDLELVSDGTNFATIFTGSATLTGLSVSNGGAYHELNDVISFTSSTAYGTASVKGVTNLSSLSFKIDKGGDGFTLGNTVIKVLGGSGSGSSVAVTALSNTHLLSFNTDIINSIKNVVLNTGPTFVSAGANSTAVSAPLAAANISSTLSSALYFKTATVGRINEITVTNPGKNYVTLPTNVFAVDPDISTYQVPDIANGGIYGNNAVITIGRAPGTITTLNIIGSGVTFIQGDPITLTNITRGTTVIANTNIDLNSITRTTLRNTTYNPSAAPASGEAITGVINLGGRYIGTRGFLSWDNKLEDNDYYQQFSYVIQVSEQVSKYNDVLKRLLHPAGTKFFGTYEMNFTANWGIENINRVS